MKKIHLIGALAIGLSTAAFAQNSTNTAQSAASTANPASQTFLQSAEAYPNAGNGDPGRVAFTKINNNFALVQNQLTNFNGTNIMPGTVNSNAFDAPTLAIIHSGTNGVNGANGTNGVNGTNGTNATFPAWTSTNVNINSTSIGYTIYTGLGRLPSYVGCNFILKSNVNVWNSTAMTNWVVPIQSVGNYQAWNGNDLNNQGIFLVAASNTVTLWLYQPLGGNESQWYDQNGTSPSAGAFTNYYWLRFYAN
jgi:hypothetical protein